MDGLQLCCMLLKCMLSGKRTIGKCPYFDVSAGQDFVKVLCLFSVPPHGLFNYFSARRTGKLHFRRQKYLIIAYAL